MISAYLSSSRAYPWPVAKLERRHYVALAGRSQQGNLPGLILQCAGKAKTRFQEEVSVHGYVVLSSALREILSVNVAMAKLDADFLLRTQPVVAAYCFTLRCPAYPGTDELAVIGVAVQVLPVTVIAAIACGEVHRTCRTPLQPEIKLGNPRKSNESKPSLDRRLGGTIERGNLILLEGI